VEDGRKVEKKERTVKEGVCEAGCKRRRRQREGGRGGEGREGGRR
jgi:hypothetical protein